jgi:hypothetical protein
MFSATIGTGMISCPDWWRSQPERLVYFSIAMRESLVTAISWAAHCRVQKKTWKRKSWYRREGVDLQVVISLVANALGMESEEVCAAGKHPHHVQARSLLCYWAVREVGLTATSLARYLRISQPAVTQAVERGERLIVEIGVGAFKFGVDASKLGVAALRLGVGTLKLRVVALKLGVAALKLRVTALKLGVVALKLGANALKLGANALKLGANALKLRVVAFKVRVGALKTTAMALKLTIAGFKMKPATLKARTDYV